VPHRCCPVCDRVLSLPDDALGKRYRCTECGSTLACVSAADGDVALALRAGGRRAGPPLLLVAAICIEWLVVIGCLAVLTIQLDEARANEARFEERSKEIRAGVEYRHRETQEERARRIAAREELAETAPRARSRLRKGMALLVALLVAHVVIALGLGGGRDWARVGALVVHGGTQFLYLGAPYLFALPVVVAPMLYAGPVSAWFRARRAVSPAAAAPAAADRE
jgi:hypothetical protein